MEEDVREDELLSSGDITPIDAPSSANASAVAGFAAQAAHAAHNLNKACEGCRQSKLRCIIDETSTEGICKRCLATNRECLFKAPRARQRRRVHVDARVAELEKQLRTLRMQLDQAQKGLSERSTGSASNLRFEPPVTPASWPRKIEHPGHVSVSNSSSRPATPSQRQELHLPFSSGTVADDVVARGVITLGEAEHLVQVYLQHFATVYPFVVLPGFTGAEALREKRPATFLAILAAASVTRTPELQKALNHDLLIMVARRTMLEGEHDLDLVQAMIVMTIWYAPLDRFESLRHYQYAHLAATMATDIGLGGDYVEDGDEISVQEDLDRCRTLLSIYLLCTGISVTTGRTNMLRFDTYKQKCINRLKSRTQGHSTDRWFVVWVESQRLTELAGEAFFYEPVNMTLPQNQARVTEFITKLEQWRAKNGFELGGALEIHYQYARAITLCSILYVNHDPEDFRPPFRVRPIAAQLSSPLPLSPFLVRTVAALVQTVHAALEAFLSFDDTALMAAPMVYYVRTCHALSILLIVDMEIQRPRNELVKAIDQQTLRISHYFAALKHMLALRSQYKSSARFFALIEKMEVWWLKQIDDSKAAVPIGGPPCQDLRPFSQTENADEQIRPHHIRRRASEPSYERAPAEPVKSDPAMPTISTVQTAPQPASVMSHSTDGLTTTANRPDVAPFTTSLPMEDQDVLLENWVLDMGPEVTAQAQYPAVQSGWYAVQPPPPPPQQYHVQDYHFHRPF